MPRSQRLRKTGRIFGEAELRLIRNDGIPDTEECARLAGILELLGQDGDFPPAAAGLFRETLETLERIHTNAGAADSGTRGETGAESRRRTLLRSFALIRRLLLAETGRFEADWDFIDQEGCLDVSKRRPFPGMQVYLEDIRSPFNVGSMFRSAESFGAEKIWLSPLCADPRHPRAARSAMGCIDALPWERIEEVPWNGTAPSGGTAAAAPCRNPPPFSGPFFALETGGTGLADFPFPPQGTMIVGSEELGVSPRSLAAAEASLGRVSIPTFGLKGSLSASAAFAIAMHAWAAALYSAT
ncbi:MAG: TrmH family RNA methyltransferase [Treponema sp.]|nr:TrmH family RNA methyltransferase [Treponema sp.]